MKLTQIKDPIQALIAHESGKTVIVLKDGKLCSIQSAPTLHQLQTIQASLMDGTTSKAELSAITVELSHLNGAKPMEAAITESKFYQIEPSESDLKPARLHKTSTPRTPKPPKFTGGVVDPNSIPDFWAGLSEAV